MQPSPPTRFAHLGCETGSCNWDPSPGFTSRGPRLRLFSLPLLLLASVPLLAGCTPRDPVEHARALIEDGRVEAAIDELQKAVEAHPEDARLQHHYGALLLKNGKASRAVWPLRRAALDPDHAVESGLLLARALLSGRNPADAVHAAESVLERDPDNWKALAIRAQALLDSHQEEAAIEEIDRLLALRPNELGLMQAKVEALLKIERAEEAEVLIAELRSQVGQLEDPEPGVAEKICGLDAVFTAERGDADAAREKFDGCLAAFPDNGVVRRAAVDFFDHQREFERGTEILQQTLERNPERLGIRAELASRLHALEQSDEAEQLLRAGAELLDTHAAWATLADHYVAVGNLAAARDAIDSAYRKEAAGGAVELPYDEISEHGLFAFGDILVQLGENERVERIIEHLEEPAHRHFLTARMQYEAGDFRAALATYAEGLRLWPGNAAARYLAAQAALKTGDFDLAISHYRESLRTDASKSDAGLELARILLAQGQPAGAYDALRHHVSSHPIDAEALRLWANLVAQSGNQEQLKLARSALSALPGQRGVAIADHARDTARTEGAAIALKFIDDNVADLADPEYRETLRASTEILANDGRHEEGLERVAAAIEANPDDGSLHSARGQALLWADQPDQAEAAFARAIELDPGDAEALIALARLKANRGDVLEALALYDGAANATPDDPEPRYEAALLISRESGPDARARAERQLRELLAAHPTHGKTAAALARLAVERGETGDETVALAVRGARFHADPAALETLGLLRLSRGENEAAVQALRWAVELGSTDGGTHYELGRALAAAGDIDGARGALKDALAKGDFPKIDAARLELDRLDRTVSEM